MSIYNFAVDGRGPYHEYWRDGVQEEGRELSKMVSRQQFLPQCKEDKEASYLVQEAWWATHYAPISIKEHFKFKGINMTNIESALKLSTPMPLLRKFKMLSYNF